jgi:hypothetical protein
MFRSEQGDERRLDAADTSIRPTLFVSLTDGLRVQYLSVHAKSARRIQLN